MSLFQNKYKTQSARHKDWDYSSDGFYFVTICTKNMREFFGEIVNGEMKLSEVGKIADEYWQEIPKHFPFVKLDEFIVMPNHLHGIIEIQHVESRHGVALHENRNSFSKPLKGSLSVIVNHFKGVVTRHCRSNGFADFQWQPRFYDRIVRNETALGKIQEYIERNPKFWDEDKNKVENIFY